MAKTLEERADLRRIINQKLEEARAISEDANVLLKELQKGCLHEQVVQRWRPLLLSPEMIRRCLACGITEKIYTSKEFVFLVSDSSRQVTLMDETEFEGLGVLPPLRAEVVSR